MAINSSYDAFNPGVQGADPGSVGSPSEYLKYSKGTSQPDADMSKGLFLKGLGDNIELAAKAGDAIVKDNIKEDIYNEVDAERQGYTDALETFSGVKRKPGGIMRQGGVTPNSPQEVQNVGNQVQSLQTAYDSGKISNTYYYGRLNTLAKTLRSQYPGYRDYVDQQISSVTGVNPANAYITSLMADINRNTEKKDGDVSTAIGLLKQDDIIGVPGASERIVNLMRNPTPERIADAVEFASKNMAWKADEKRRTARHTALTQGRTENSWYAEDDLTTLSARAASGFSDNLVYNVQNPQGGTQARKITDLVTAAMDPNSGVVISTEQAQDMSKIVQQERKRLYTELLGKATAIIPGTRNESLATRASGIDKAKKIIEGNLQGLDLLASSLSAENYTLAADAANRVAAITDDARRGMYTSKDMGPYITTLNIIRKDLGEQAAGDIAKTFLVNKDGIGKQFENYANDNKAKFRAQPDLSVNPETGKPATIKEAIDDAKLKGIKDKGVFNTYVNEIDRLTDPRASLKEKQNLAIAFFDRSNAGMMANFRVEDSYTDPKTGQVIKTPQGLNQNTVWSKLTSDKVTQEMKSLGGEYWNNYRSWVETEFGASTRNNLANARDLKLPDQEGIRSKIGWDNVNKQFVLDINGSDYLLKNAGSVPPGARIDAWNANIPNIQQGQRVLGSINRQLKTFNNVIKQDGRDSDAYIYQILKDGIGTTIANEMLNSIQTSRGAKPDRRSSADMPTEFSSASPVDRNDPTKLPGYIPGGGGGSVPTRKITGYRIMDRQTGQQIGKDYGPDQGSRARSRVDKLDNEYGAYRYLRQPIYEGE